MSSAFRRPLNCTAIKLLVPNFPILPKMFKMKVTDFYLNSCYMNFREKSFSPLPLPKKSKKTLKTYSVWFSRLHWWEEGTTTAFPGCFKSSSTVFSLNQCWVLSLRCSFFSLFTALAFPSFTPLGSNLDEVVGLRTKDTRD